MHAGEDITIIRDGATDENYSQANLSRAMLYGEYNDCVFNHADMFGVDISDCNFRNCTFSFCDMTDSCMEKAVFQKCTFVGCNLRDVDAADTYILECSMQACIAIDASFTDSIWIDSSISGNFMGSKWGGTKFTNVDHKNILLLGADGFPA